MCVKFFHSLVSDCLFDGVEHLTEIVLRFESAVGTRIEMSEIDAGNNPLVDFAEFHYLIKVAQLIDFAHRFGAKGDVTEPFVVQRNNRLLKGIESEIYCIVSVEFSL